MYSPIQDFLGSPRLFQLDIGTHDYQHELSIVITVRLRYVDGKIHFYNFEYVVAI